MNEDDKDIELSPMGYKSESLTLKSYWDYYWPRLLPTIAAISASTAVYFASRWLWMNVDSLLSTLLHLLVIAWLVFS